MAIKRNIKLQETRKGYFQATIPKILVEECGLSGNDILELRASKRGIRIVRAGGGK